ncbi:MAG: hypothetical protein PHC54_03100 [Candidatus Omnitrophica bacterium]|nr:hypothetical protein [Candidatus Omnitrophota bacterium]MDD5592139.1 hypothetical protein [Candidatus Omnitrophota bacterium]
MDRHDTLNLKKRYLIWLYKAAKEAQDKIERKFTQLEIDRFILKELEKENAGKNFIAEFKQYIENKEKDGLSLKYKNKKLSPNYLFLALKLKAIEKAIIHELGQRALKEIKTLYEKEMTQRILKSTEQK